MRIDTAHGSTDDRNRSVWDDDCSAWKDASWPIDYWPGFGGQWKRVDTLRGKSVAIHDPSSCLIANAFGAHDHQQNKSPQLHRPENIFLPSCSYRHFPQDQKLWAGSPVHGTHGAEHRLKGAWTRDRNNHPHVSPWKSTASLPGQRWPASVVIRGLSSSTAKFLLPHFLGGHFRDFLSNSAKHLPFPNLAWVLVDSFQLNSFGGFRPYTTAGLTIPPVGKWLDNGWIVVLQADPPHPFPANCFRLTGNQYLMLNHGFPCRRHPSYAN